MRYHVVFFVCILGLLGCSKPSVQRQDLVRAKESAPPEYAGLLAKYTRPKGIRYGAWHQNSGDLASLDKVTDYYAYTLPPKEQKAALAWHVNAYNAWILRNILKKYPTRSPLDGDPLFFHGNRIVISEKQMSFNDLEQKVIRQVYKEPRVHFVLNCASKSCPPLNAKPITAATLDADLDRLTNEFVTQNPYGVVIERESVLISKIFEWYAGDFGGKGRQIEFINRYRKYPVPIRAKIEFMDYNWNLNEI